MHSSAFRVITIPPSRRGVKGCQARPVNPTALDPAGVDEVRSWLRVAGRVVVLTGAGISTDSGIPDFRGPQGVWTRDPAAQRRATLANELADPELRRQAWRNRLASPAWAAQPNAGHRALVDLERTGRLVALVTQNIDELHQAAGSDPALVVELHGSMRRARCYGCEEEGPMAAVLERVAAGEEDPACRTCGGILSSATVKFGQSLDPAVLERARRAAASCDLLLAAGSSLTVHPAAGLVPTARAAGARVVVLNGEPTPYDAVADAVLRGPLGELLPAVAGGLGGTGGPPPG